MWIYMIVGVLVVVGLLGGIVAGGVFTLVLIPIAVVVLLAGLVYTAMGRSAEGRQAAGGSSSPSPLPHNLPAEPSHVPDSPESLADARRVQQ
jgi:cell division protein FtsN